MDPRDEDRPYDEFGDSDDPLIEELRAEMVRLEAQIDQLSATARDRAAEIAELRARLAELEVRIEAIQARYRRGVRLWAATAAVYGIAVGLVLSWLTRF
jgi:tetrahydromethanopterin S-methyltransferase subunit G